MELVPYGVWAPFGALGIVAFLLYLLFRALQTGALVPRNQVQELRDQWHERLAREERRGDDWRDSFRRLEESHDELVASTRVIADAMQAIRQASESQ